MSGQVADEGFCPVDKPAGPTSHDVVRQARKALGTRRIGHAGTLDPFATGLLVLGVGRATRLIEYLSPLDKEYVAVARLGVRTSTLDPEGEVLSRTEAWRDLPVATIEDVLNTFQGPRSQMPPRFSAKRVGGERAYARARRGEPTELRPVGILIHAIELLDVSLPMVRFRVRCSTGTYVRVLGEEFGDELGVGAHLTALRRTAIGPFRVDDAVPVEELGAAERVRDAWISPLQALSHLPRVEVSDRIAERLVHGQSPELGSEVDTGAGDLPEGEPVAVVCGEELVCVGRREGMRLRPSKVFGSPASAVE